MKLRSIIFGSAVAAAATASALTTTNTFARLPVSANYASTIIALPFSGCGMAEGSIYVTNLVMTTNLEKGDTLLYKDGSSWKAWEIDASGKWVGVTTSTAGGVSVTPPASEVALACGTACWLNRQTPSNTFYLYGQVNAAKTDVAVAVGNGTKPAYTIVGCPYEAGEFDIRNINGALNGDTVLLMANNDVGKVEYKYVSGAWKKESSTPATGSFPNFTPGTSEWVDLDSSEGKVPAGCGFMYGRLSSTALTITWGD